MTDRLVVTSIVRRAGRSERSGHVSVVDLARRRVVMRSVFAEASGRELDPNRRGGLRGVRGASVLEDRLVIANAEALFVFDRAWRPVRRISHPWMGGVHDVLAEEEGIWVTCTTADLLLRVDWSGRPVDDWEWRSDERLMAAFGLGRLPPVDRGVDYRDPRSVRGRVPNTVHLNAVTRGTEGLLLSFGRVLSPAALRRARIRAAGARLHDRLLGPLAARRVTGPPPAGPPPHEVTGERRGTSSSAIVRLGEEGGARIVHREPGIEVPNHDVLELPAGLAFNDSNRNRVVLLAAGGRREAAVAGRDGFVRGMAAAEGNTVWVGGQRPAAIYRVDCAAGRVLDRIELGGDPRETVYAICPLPRRFGPPPERLSLPPMAPGRAIC